MKTSSWTPAGPSGFGASDQLGLAQRFAISAHGKRPDELEAIGAVYLAVAYMRTSLQFSVSTLEGVEVAHNRSGKLTGDLDFLSAMHLMEQAVTMERNRAINDTINHIAAHAGIDPADLPGNEGAAR